MLQFVRATPRDVLAIRVQPSQAGALAFFERPDAADVMALGPSYAAWDGLRCIAAAGLTPKWEGVATAWTILSADAGPHLLAVTKRCRAMLDAAPFRRIEATAACDFPPAGRWLAQLGFELETPRAEGYTPDGQDVAIYKRIRRNGP